MLTPTLVYQDSKTHHKPSRQLCLWEPEIAIEFKLDITTSRVPTKVLQMGSNLQIYIMFCTHP